MFYWEESTPHIERLLRLAFKTEGTNRFQHGYKDIESLITDVRESSWVGVFEDESHSVHGFVIIEWIAERIANLHVGTFTNDYDWCDVWSKIIEPEVSNYVDQLYAVIPKETPAVVVLAKRVGFTFSKVGNYYKGLKDL